MKDVTVTDCDPELPTDQDAKASVNETGNISTQTELTPIPQITFGGTPGAWVKQREDEYLRLDVRPCELKEANELVARWHRHHKPVQGHRFSLKAVDEQGIVHGAAIIGRPVARNNNQREWVEVTRLATDGTRNVCSLLYAAAARAAKEMGYEKIITYTLEEEEGVSLRAVRWTYEGLAGGGDWNVPSRGGRRVDQPMGRKKRWGKWLRGRG